MKKSIHYPVVLLTIAALCIAGIDGVYVKVEKKIRISESKKALEAVCCIFKDCPAEQAEKLEHEYEGDKVEWFRCPSGCSVITSGPGFDGPVTVMSGWDSDWKLSGIYVLKHTETPGLGANVNLVNSENTWYNLLAGTMKDETGKRPDFQEQFSGLTLDEAKLKQDGGKIDALTGATITSRAVCDAVQKSHKVLKTILAGQDQ